ncbi:hypothetical protein BCR44DRAFT_1499966 [Catenaria anguillulae PL171]|uniref:Phospholipid-transporting ATPase n=1 Tax=Catenaria anguillulae PL171 TaxID=765915 RepID=A0A1Y2HKD2_9FUNG|nr:hypothetical protein BCR44DRAFT_1499966 [Catenaria anguillulae PL171]
MTERIRLVQLSSTNASANANATASGSINGRVHERTHSGQDHNGDDIPPRGESSSPRLSLGPLASQRTNAHNSSSGGVPSSYSAAAKKARTSDLLDEGLGNTYADRDEEQLIGSPSPHASSPPADRHYSSPAFPQRQPRIFQLPVTFDQRKPRQRSYAPNAVRNQKYSLMSFVPMVLYEQFKFFFNLYFLLVALSQFIPSLQIGYLFTYFGPLVFVLLVTMAKEANDDWKRRKRDLESNSQHYPVLNPETGTFMHLPSSALVVGDLVQINKNQRVPADLVLLRTHDRQSASCFVRTDQLDGETDWKLRVAVHATQVCASDAAVASEQWVVDAEAPSKDIHTFEGTMTPVRTGAASFGQQHVEPLTVDNMLWMNTVLASPDPVLGCVVYTGADTRAVMNTNAPTAKVGLLDMEYHHDYFSGFHGAWIVYLVRFLILFSSIIPISLRVNLDMGKLFYAQQIMHDPEIPDTIVRTSTIPEELGRIEYLLSDKTGTLTRNEMDMKKVHVGTMSFATDSFDEMRALVAAAVAGGHHSAAHPPLSPTLAPSTPTLLSTSLTANSWTSTAAGGAATSAGAKRHAAKTRDMSSRARDLVLALALCHNVNLIVSELDGSISLQAASPDEIALVRWATSMGISLVHRDANSIRLRLPNDQVLEFEILHVFPFTSESKRMGIVVRDVNPATNPSGEGMFLQKGADAVMTRLVQYNDWLEEECGNMSREGLRTLVVGRKRLSHDQLARFLEAYHAARTTLVSRAEAMQAVVAQFLERDLEILGLTGVEDKLQDDVRPTLEALRNAGIKVWMLTGDKIETATCIALSSKLVSRQQAIYTLSKVRSATEADEELDRLAHVTDACLIIDGESLAFCLEFTRTRFLAWATRLPAVVCCRCSPTQKAQVTELIKEFTGKRVCCIGDGGNDVSMIQAAHVGVGIVGKEGRQASLAADFSAVFSAIFYFAPIALYQGMLLVGYTTIYTMAPVTVQGPGQGPTPLVQDFFVWLLVSVYQGGAIMMFALVLFDNDFVHVVSISFTSLVFNELLMVALEIVTWHRYMVWAQVWTGVVYLASMAILPEFDLDFILTWSLCGR